MTTTATKTQKRSSKRRSNRYVGRIHALGGRLFVVVDSRRRYEITGSDLRSIKSGNFQLGGKVSFKVKDHELVRGSFQKIKEEKAKTAATGEKTQPKPNDVPLNSRGVSWTKTVGG